MHKYRTHTCGELNSSLVGKKVRLSGWIHRKRDHGGVFFIDLRDHYGISQVVSSDQDDRLIRFTKDRYLELTSLSYESVVTITGTVVARSQETINADLSTGEIEVVAEDFSVDSYAEPLPITVNSDIPFPEDLRLKYRFLDLRRERLHNNIILRNQVIAFIRQQMTDIGFMEFQTPILTASSPEGARDFLVPSRLHPGSFYALPQAPQQFKQLLMVSGFDRYFQIAPCFRDEDARADRAPGEFYQLDVEMSFVTQEDVFTTIEPVLYNIFKKFSANVVTDVPFPRITYHDAMLKYGSDKPDLRNPIEICDVSEIFKDSNFTIFKEAIAQGFIVRAVPAPQASLQPRSFFDKMAEFAQNEFGARGLGYINFAEDGNAKGPIAKFLSIEKLNELKVKAKLSNTDAVFFVCDKEVNANKIAGKVRTKLGEDLKLIADNVFKLCWIIDFPYYEWNEDERKVDFSHNPFSMPQGGLAVLEAADTQEKQLDIKAYQYDIVCNGIELCSGAIRNHKPEIMYKAFAMVGHSKDDVDHKFGGLIKAFKFGAPPHGGLAPGIDRIVMLLANEPNIREVICFPLNQQAQDLLMNAPDQVTERQLRELHLMVVSKEKK